jgi:hypothetical protein
MIHRHRRERAHADHARGFVGHEVGRVVRRRHALLA